VDRAHLQISYDTMTKAEDRRTHRCSNRSGAELTTDVKQVACGLSHMAGSLPYLHPKGGHSIATAHVGHVRTTLLRQGTSRSIRELSQAHCRLGGRAVAFAKLVQGHTARNSSSQCTVSDCVLTLLSLLFLSPFSSLSPVLPFPLAILGIGLRACAC
jgi:hypothetical protein